MKSPNWFVLSILAAILGIGAGYGITLLISPTLLPPALRWGYLNAPATILFLGTDVVYSGEPGKATPDPTSFNGRSDTVMVAHLDPIRDALGVIWIPRDTEVRISGYGKQKINAANAIGGPPAARDAVSSLLGLPIDHYVVLNLQGLVKLIDELGGITVEIPKRMRYMDWTAKLKIDLQPGFHTLTGNQAMGFVRFRHDALGDIGRVQRQQIFIRALMAKALSPDSWARLPKLIEIGRSYVSTDLGEADMLRYLAFVRAVPRENQQLVMLPGKFAADGSGNWQVDPNDIADVTARISGVAQAIPADKAEVRITIQNATTTPELGRKLARVLRDKGYNVVGITGCERRADGISRTKIIAQRANKEQADMVRTDLNNVGEIVNASLGDIDSTVTIVVGDDIEPALQEQIQQSSR